MIGCAMIDLLVFHPLSYTVVRVLYAYLEAPKQHIMSHYQSPRWSQGLELVSRPLSP
jgi:hypothetical protein